MPERKPTQRGKHRDGDGAKRRQHLASHEQVFAIEAFRHRARKRPHQQHGQGTRHEHQRNRKGGAGKFIGEKPADQHFHPTHGIGQPTRTPKLQKGAVAKQNAQR